MADNWREIVEEVDVEPDSAAGPAGADEDDWYQLLAAFGTKSFVRVLTQGETIALECAPPGDEAAARGAFQDAGWSVDGDSTPWVVSRAFPEDGESFRPLWVTIAKIADAFRDDADDALHEALAVSSAHEEAPEPERNQKDEPAERRETADEEDDDASEPSASAFETIGDDAREPLDAGEFDSVVRAGEGAVEVVLGFGDRLDPDDYDALAERIVRNLRGKYDVDVNVVGGNEVSARLDRLPATRVTLHVLPDRVVSEATLDDAEEWTREYLNTLANLAKSGVDPLVFLGVRTSSRDTDDETDSAEGKQSDATSRAAFETIGGDEPDDEAEGPVLVVADEEDEDDLDEASAADADAGGDEVVFGETDMIEPHDPLKPGRYDDPRLDRPDATTALVDVVLRHPGYSDRRIGQVLAILLSLDYSRCLEIAERAPTVIAWGVARERAQTMKTVIEGAGGRVLLSEPEEFGEP